MAESEEELKSLLLKVKEESEKAGLKLNIPKAKIMPFYPITSWQIDGEKMETVTDFIFLGSKITADGDYSHEIKRHLLLGRKTMTNLERKKESEVTQLCLTLCDPIDCSLPCSSAHGIFQVKVLEWVAFHSPGDLPNSGIEPGSPALQAEPSEPRRKSMTNLDNILKSRDVTLHSKVHIVKAVVLPVVM